MKRPRPTVLDRLRAKLAPPPGAVGIIDINDVANVCLALRRGGLLALGGSDLTAAAGSLARLEAFIKGQTPALAQPPANSPPAEAPADSKKG